MNTLTLAMLTAFTALDNASADDLRDTVETLADMATQNTVDDWVLDPIVDAIESEVDLRVGNLLDDGNPVDAYNAVSAAIREYRNS